LDYSFIIFGCFFSAVGGGDASSSSKRFFFFDYCLTITGWGWDGGGASAVCFFCGTEKLSSSSSNKFFLGCYLAFGFSYCFD
jgi:hypothetical protein